MARFNVYELTVEGLFCYQLVDSIKDTSLLISAEGANLLSWKIKHNNRYYELVDGYKSKAELNEGRLAKSRILVPFANRIQNNAYNFNGTDYSANPETFIIHGFYSNVLFQPESISGNDEFCEVVLTAPPLSPDNTQLYPFNFSFIVKFRLTVDGLEVFFTAENKENAPIPFYSGWHPYFTFNFRAISECTLQTNADTEILIDRNYIPLQGDKAFKKIQQGSNLDFSTEKQIGTGLINVCLIKDPPGTGQPLSTVFRSPQDNLQLRIEQPYGVVYIFDGRESKEEISYSVAIEPVEAITNGFNRPEMKDIILLPAYSVKTFSARLFAEEYRQQR